VNQLRRVAAVLERPVAALAAASLAAAALAAAALAAAALPTALPALSRWRRRRGPDRPLRPPPLRPRGQTRAANKADRSSACRKRDPASSSSSTSTSGYRTTCSRLRKILRKILRKVDLATRRPSALRLRPSALRLLPSAALRRLVPSLPRFQTLRRPRTALQPL